MIRNHQLSLESFRSDLREDTIDTTSLGHTMSAYTELTPLIPIPNNYELEEDETIDNPITATSGTTSLLPPEDPPHGRHLGLYSTVVLFVCRMVGSGIFATPGGIYSDIGGSVPLFLAIWISGALIAVSGLSVYLELGSLLPRSGATKVFLEYLFPNPRYFATFIFGAFNVFFNISGGNALVFGQYTRYALGLEADEKQARNLGLCLMLFALIVHGASRKFGMLVQNFVGSIKLLLSSLMIFAAIYVMVLPSSITGIKNQMTWESLVQKPNLSTTSLTVISAAVLRTIYSFGGWTTPHMVQNEIKDPIRTLKIAAPFSMLFVITLYMLLNLAYLIVIPSSDILESGELVGAMLFQELFGEVIGRRFLSSIIAISSASTLLVVVYADSNLIQSIAREGFLPFSKSLASNRPLGTPLAALVLNITISTSVLILPKTGSLYNYIVSMQVYPNQLFHALLCIGIYKARKRFPNIRAPIRAPYIAIMFCFVSSTVIFIAPMTDPRGLITSYSFGGLVLFGLTTVYWVIIVKVRPWIGGYQIVRRTVELDDGLKIKHWKKIYNY